MSRNAILSAGRDRPLLTTRNRVLEEAGYLVTSTSTAAATVENFFDGDFDLVVLCHSIPLEERERVATLVRMHSPSTPVIALADLPTRRFNIGDLTVDSDANSLLESIPVALAMAATKRPPLPSAAPRPRRTA
jgi:DNA-binding response OmpR family regulator